MKSAAMRTRIENRKSLREGGRKVGGERREKGKGVAAAQLLALKGSRGLQMGVWVMFSSSAFSSSAATTSVGTTSVQLPPPPGQLEAKWPGWLQL